MTHPKDGGMNTKPEEQETFKQFWFYAYPLYYVIVKYCDL